MKSLLKTTFRLEPGDGSGCSIKDAVVRNERGVCAMLECGKSITDDAVSYGLIQKLCPDCERIHLESLRKELCNGP